MSNLAYMSKASEALREPLESETEVAIVLFREGRGWQFRVGCDPQADFDTLSLIGSAQLMLDAVMQLHYDRMEQVGDKPK